MRKRHLVLVHGACHGAWCWYKVATRLKSAGHKVTAVDLAACGVNPKQVNEVRTLSVYNQPLFDFMEGLPSDERLILVGHSLGGLSVTLAMETFPDKISVAVFVGASAASLPSPANLSSPKKKVKFKIDFMDSEYRYDDGPDKPATSVTLGPKCLATWYYQQSPPEDLMLGKLLVRPCPFQKQEVIVTEEKYGSVRRVYVFGDRDLVVKTPTEGATFIPGGDHMLMFSKSLELSSYLLDITSKFE